MSDINVVVKQNEITVISDRNVSLAGEKGDKGEQGIPGGNITNASELPFTPTGSLSSTDVQNALAELDNEKADKLFATNLVTNGDFSNGTTGWFITTATGGVANNVYTFTPTAIHGRIQQVNINTKNGSKYYFAAMVRATKSTVALFAEQGFTYLETHHSGSGNFELLSNIYTSNSTGSIGVIQIREFGTSNFAQVEVQNVMFIDLTTLFGAGKEPTKKQMNWLLSTYQNSWFNGAAEITNIKQLFNDKADKLFATNLVTNGDFSNGTTGWVGSSGTIAVVSNVLEYTVVTPSTTVRADTSTNISSNNLDKVYCRALVTVPRNSNVELRFSDVFSQTFNVIANTPTTVSSVITSTGALTPLRIYFSRNNVLLASDICKVDNVLSTNLTTLFGSGKEPTKEQMDWLLAQKFTNSWFNGTVELTSITDLLTLVNTKADKTQEAWITPTLLNGAVHSGRPLQYRLNEIGGLEFRGELSSAPSTLGTTIFTVTGKYVPITNNGGIASRNNAFARVQLSSAGNFNQIAGSTTGSLNVDGLTINKG